MLQRRMTASKLVLWKKLHVNSEAELAVESYGNVQFYQFVDKNPIAVIVHTFIFQVINSRYLDFFNG